ncbi:Solute carrier family 2 facilitated glucose transporter member 11' [Scophthalmus maximus]|uniref:Solute carrier family 2 facilitated glucose transporter member 11 n=1 Tax=Scophthalmus maximus TaxID=52904 RepID=A0A2U9BH10_SCOMX|nr:Solute carrier family 2 facilitated glucose transporter member 11' [Scophthalmus maximus]
METSLQQLTRGNALLLIIILGIGGTFQHGYQLTGLSSPSPYIQCFINSSWYDKYGEPPPAQTVTMIWSLIVSLYAIGGLFGAVSVKLISGRLGRKKAVILNNFIAIVAGGIMLTSKMANSYEMVIVARILYGYSAGLGLSIHVMYLGEISPRKIRGIVTFTSGTFLSLGKLSGQFFGLSEILGREELWNIVLCVPSFFSLVTVIVLPFLPEAPRYLLIEKGDDKACKKALQSLWGQGDYKEEMDEMLAEQSAMKAAPPKRQINIFSFDIFMEAGIPRDMIRYITLGLGVSEIITLISCGLMIERTGRKPLLWGGYGVMCVCWLLVTVTMNLKDSNYWAPYLAAALIIIFIIFFCGGPGGVISTLNTELFIQSNRVAALVLTGIQRWLMFVVVGLVFPFLITALGSYSFVLFGCMCLLGFLYTFFVLPETKEKTLLEISEEFKAITVCGKSFAENKIVETKL